MGLFNYYGLIAIIIIMVPNILCAIFNKAAFENNFNNKPFQIIEQIGRYGCMCFMIFNVPYTYFNFWFDSALIVYLVVNGLLCVAYIVCWIVFWNKQGKSRALLLSIVPSVIFAFSGIILANIPLIAFAVLFAVNHILLSYKNVAINC